MYLYVGTGSAVQKSAVRSPSARPERLRIRPGGRWRCGPRR